MRDNHPHVSIIMLNWNGWQDTIECLESVLRSDYPNYNVMLLDNHSLDDSVENIKRWATDARCQAINSSLKEFTYPPVSKPIRLVVIPIEFYRQQKRGKPTNQEINVGTIMLVNNSQNSGFAAGNNIGIRIAQKTLAEQLFFSAEQ